jgi:hypothetical protein
MKRSALPLVFGGEDELEAEPFASPTESSGTIARSVVSHDALDWLN